MKILHVLDHSLPLHSGYTFRTAAILREQRRLGWDTIHLTTPRHGAYGATEEMADGWTFFRTPMSSTWRSLIPGGRYFDEMRATEARLDAMIRLHQPDVLHPHSPVLNAIPAIKAGKRHGIPVVYEIRASWEDAAVDHGTTKEGSVRYRISRGLETWAVRNATEVTTICEGLKADILVRDIPESKVTVIPNAVDVEEFVYNAPPDESLRDSLGLRGAEVVGFAGSFYGYEGLDLLLDAVARLVGGHPALKVLLVGGGPKESELKAQAAALGLSERVIFTGRVPHADVARYYNLIDVLAYPRKSMRLTELVTPLKPLEAMAQGRMFVASAVGGHRELVAHEHTGFLFNAGDAANLADTIHHVLSHRELWPRIRTNARRFVESERTWRRSVARYQDVYARAIAAVKR
ncbi:MAG: hypothetical protein RIS21_286 [Planctomycetota bacterium]